MLKLSTDVSNQRCIYKKICVIMCKNSKATIVVQQDTELKLFFHTCAQTSVLRYRWTSETFIFPPWLAHLSFHQCPLWLLNGYSTIVESSSNNNSYISRIICITLGSNRLLLANTTYFCIKQSLNDSVPFQFIWQKPLYILIL